MHPARPSTMPIFVLLLLALVSGLLIALVFDRLAPAKGATAAAAEAVEHLAETSSLRMWWRARTDPALRRVSRSAPPSR